MEDRREMTFRFYRCCTSVAAVRHSALPAALSSYASPLTVLCSEEREPDMHISLIMSQLKYQSRAPSHLTKAEVMKPRALKLNETARGRRAGGRGLPGWEGAKSEAEAGAEVKSI